MGRLCTFADLGIMHMREKVARSRVTVSGVTARVAETIAHGLPGPGEARDGSDIFGAVQARIIGLMAGGAAEMAILGGRPPQFMASDVASAHLLARIICRSEASRTALVEHGYEEALCIVSEICIVSENRAVVLAIARALIEHPERTLDGPDIDLVIGQTLAREGLNAERARRQSWRRVIGSAAAFKPD